MLRRKNPIAVFSDIHSNLEAFQAILQDMRRTQFSFMICLGDVIGYAADPGECTDLVRSLDIEILKGNHDFAAIDNPTMLEMSGPAVRGIKYARQHLSAGQCDFLAGLPMTSSSNDCQFVHSSLDHPENWTYLMREPEIREHFKVQTQPVAFCGHTHIPAVIWLNTAGEVKLLGREGRIELPGEGKILINAGSVGQPRDRCPDACYVIYDSATRAVEFRRLHYNIEEARRKIVQAELPMITGQRLTVGR
jgi:diadenosine tetraphosphatase ApaH/serine/threonine PP2A family protein phosphatase